MDAGAIIGDCYSTSVDACAIRGGDIWVNIIILLAILQSPYYLKSNLNHKENPLFHLLLKPKLAHQGYYSIKSLVFH